MTRIPSFLLALATCLLCTVTSLQMTAQSLTSDYIDELRQDRRGPYAGIKWFCEDGTMREARDPCPEPLEGVQHAIYKDRVKNIAQENHIFLDQILTGTEYKDMWDADRQHSRLLQYQLTNFLYHADNGWILEQAQNYRGAKQIEDEREWGQEFLEWACGDDARMRDDYLLLRMAARSIPHGDETDLTQRVRALSKSLAEEDNRFMDLRTQIHNLPSASNLKQVKDWKKETDKLSEKASDLYEKLVLDMTELYAPTDVQKLLDYLSPIKSTKLYSELSPRLTSLSDQAPSRTYRTVLDILADIRSQVLLVSSASGRVGLLDLSWQLEQMAAQGLAETSQAELYELREDVCYLSGALYGLGYLEKWEYDKLEIDISWFQASKISVSEYDYYRHAAAKPVQWSTQMLSSLYVEDIHRFKSFEPLTAGFLDDMIRSTLILPLGDRVAAIQEQYLKAVGSNSEAFGRKAATGMQGLNPGFALAELVVLDDLPENLVIDKSKIYAFNRPPADLKPVAGLLNVQEGNPVSHVQLLARNLAIPNALISDKMLKSLKKYSGERVFYAVSPGGTVVIKSEDNLTAEEKKLVKKKSRDSERVTINTSQIILDPDSLLDLRDMRAEMSGKWAGPKAAHLGQLKAMYPEHVVDGFVIPFGVFRDHMGQKIPGWSCTYWDYLRWIFQRESDLLSEGLSAKSAEDHTLSCLEEMHDLILEMPLKKSLVDAVEKSFREKLGSAIGKVPVFLRSDTNMEDLPQFTGAGLNLTLFNVLDRESILQGINRVWASPYTERSYQWRQQYLANPEEVYPSILIIPSVNVDRSGVIITKGVNRGGDDAISISFSRGVGGAVEGQSAESYVIYPQGYAELISPGRETKYRTIPPTGGSTYAYADLGQPTLSSVHVNLLTEMAKDISLKMDSLHHDRGAYDIELGILDDHVWLFQVRPFVENNDALASEYLASLDPTPNQLKNNSNEKYISL